jgi:multidrug resistance efflux pump
MENKEDYKIEVRSEAIQEIIGRPPAWIIRWGITVIFIMMMTLLGICAFIEFPESISSRVVFTSKNAPVGIVAKTTGRIHFMTENKEQVKTHQMLGYITNSANLDDVLILEKDLNELKKKLYEGQLLADLGKVNLPVNLVLGDLQPQYRILVNTIESLQTYISLKSSQKKIQGLNQQLEYNNSIISQSRKRESLLKTDESLIRKKITADSLLYEKKVITKFEYDDAKRNLIQAEVTKENANSSTTSNLIQTSMLESQISEINNTDLSTKKTLSLAIETAMKEMEHQISEWENRYLLIAPYDGEINFASQWSNDQMVNLNDEVMRIVPKKNILFCKAFVPMANSGKMVKGQTANIRIDNYPYTDYGIVKGKIQYISSVPINNFYIASILLPNGLTTTYHKRIELRQEMQGTADIITNERTILGSIFNKLIFLINANK